MLCIITDICNKTTDDRMKILTYDDLFKQAQTRVNALKELL